MWKKRERMNNMKVIFMGTPDYAVGALQAIVDAGYEVTAVVTQPDKTKGRGKEMQMPPVKECAIKNHIPVLQPKKIKEAQAIEELRRYEADIFVVAAFGQILSKEILEMPKYGCVNIHASLLPKYRGAAPIQWAILDGEEKTGITIMQMNEGIDTGDILMQEEVPITADETGESLFGKLTDCGAKLIVKALPLIEQGLLTPIKQDEQKSSYAKMLKKSIGEIDFSKEAAVIERKVRGLNSWPSAYTKYKGKTLKIWSASVESGDGKGTPGTVESVSKDSFIVCTGKDRLKITSVQPEGKKRMEVSAFLLGYQVEEGMVFPN